MKVGVIDGCMKQVSFSLFLLLPILASIIRATDHPNGLVTYLRDLDETLPFDLIHLIFEISRYKFVFEYVESGGKYKAEIGEAAYIFLVTSDDLKQRVKDRIYPGILQYVQSLSEEERKVKYSHLAINTFSRSNRHYISRDAAINKVGSVTFLSSLCKCYLPVSMSSINGNFNMFLQSYIKELAALDSNLYTTIYPLIKFGSPELAWNVYFNLWLVMLEHYSLRYHHHNYNLKILDNWLPFLKGTLAEFMNLFERFREEISLYIAFINSLDAINQSSDLVLTAIFTKEFQTTIPNGKVHYPHLDELTWASADQIASLYLLMHACGCPNYQRINEKLEMINPGCVHVYLKGGGLSPFQDHGEFDISRNTALERQIIFDNCFHDLDDTECYLMDDYLLDTTLSRENFEFMAHLLLDHGPTHEITGESLLSQILDQPHVGCFLSGFDAAHLRFIYEILSVLPPYFKVEFYTRIANELFPDTQLFVNSEFYNQIFESVPEFNELVIEAIKASGQECSDWFGHKLKDLMPHIDLELYLDKITKL